MREEWVYGSGCDPVLRRWEWSWEPVKGRERRAQDLRRTGKVNVLGKKDERSM